MDVVRRVFVLGEPVHLEVGPGPDGFGVELRTGDAKSAEYFGTIEITFDKDLARVLGEALIACAGEVES